MGSMICYPCAQYKLRYMALNHVSPGSGWSNYTCCQSMFGGCCCIQPGNLGEGACAFLLRETGEAGADALSERLEAVTGLAEAVIAAQVGQGE